MAAFNYKDHHLEYDIFRGDKLRHVAKSLLGKPNTILFLHGINDSYQNHIDLITILLNKGYDVYALNFPGHGHSERASQIGWDILADMVKQFIIHQHLRNLIVYAYSMGASVTLKLLEQQLPQIVQVKLHAPFCESVSPSVLDTMINTLRFAMNELRNRNVRPDKLPAPMQDVSYIAKDYLPMFMKYSIDLKNNKLPITCVISDEDEIIDQNTVKHQLSHVPNCHVVVISGIGHDLYYLPLHKQLLIINSLGF